SYRHEIIDLNKRKYPTRREFKLLLKAQKVGLNVPEPLLVDENEMKVVMEYLKGDVLKQTLDTYSKQKREKVAIEMGKQTAKMHDNDIIHGDLTTSNMILNKKVYFIDFGLGFISPKEEHKAVDIHLLKQALESKHYKHFEELYKNFLKGYKTSKNYKKVMERLEKVELRGRYKRKH
ncbi:Kae1-associated serine/threonine protein kinase, partial [archaeon]|nr:Kae1-associated serine/threonine protein kinase [archaeon]